MVLAQQIPLQLLIAKHLPQPCRCHSWAAKQSPQLTESARAMPSAFVPPHNALHGPAAILQLCLFATPEAANVAASEMVAL